MVSEVRPSLMDCFVPRNDAKRQRFNNQRFNNMKTFVNDTEVRTYYGAKVKSVVLAYCRANNLPLKLEGIEVRDAYGNVIDLDGSLRANSKIFVKF